MHRRATATHAHRRSKVHFDQTYITLHNESPGLDSLMPGACKPKRMSRLFTVVRRAMQDKAEGFKLKKSDDVVSETLPAKIMIFHPGAKGKSYREFDHYNQDLFELKESMVFKKARVSTMVKKRWTADEDELLTKLVDKYNRNWVKIW